MKKALIVIGYKTVNYGSLLQALATQKMFERHGIIVNVANIDLMWKSFKIKKVLFYLSNLQFYYLIKSKGKMFLSKFVYLFNDCYRCEYNKRLELFNAFIDERLNLSRRIKNYEDIKNLAQNYDFVILGSDQVWLPSSVVSDIYTLSFAWGLDNVKTISYAPSFGIDYILPKYKEFYKRMFENINYISVREESGISIIKDLIGKNVPSVADPVLMFDKREWDEIIPEKNVKEEKYIFVYLIGNNKKHRKRVIEFAKKKNLCTVAIVHLDEYIKLDEFVYDDYYISASPEDFLNYLRHAEYVFTDSYHCFLFALLYEKKVGVFARFSDKSKVSTNNRFYSIMNKLNITNGILDENKEIDETKVISECERINHLIGDYRAFSEQFIAETIK